MLLEKRPFIRITWLDGTGSNAQSRHHLPSRIEPGAALAVASSYLAAASAVSDCVIVGCDVEYEFIEITPGTQNIVPGVNGAYFVFKTAMEDQFVTIFFPAILSAFFDPLDDRVLDGTNPLVLDLANACIGFCCNPFGHVATELLAVARGIVEY